MTQLKAGDKAPNFVAVTHEGENISLVDFAGTKLILYFYPKDNTPGCTAQACSLRDGHEELLGLGYRVIGVSPDGVKSHTTFRAKHNLPFTLIADTGRDLAKTYGVYGEKKLYGKPVMGVHRTTFIIDANGIIERVISRVDTKDHVRQILEAN